MPLQKLATGFLLPPTKHKRLRAGGQPNTGEELLACAPHTLEVVRDWITERHVWLTIQAPSNIDLTLQIDMLAKLKPLALPWN